MTDEPLKVLIADDHPLILTALRRALEDSDGIEVVGQASTKQQLLALVERRRPAVVLLDLRMPDVSGTEHIEELTTTWPEVKVVVLSASDDRPSVDAALRAGASAFMVKSVNPSEIPGVLRQVTTGSVFHAATGADAPRGLTGSGRDPWDRADSLTERERAILGHAAQGLTTAEISRTLWISESTVKFHLTNIYRKLGVPNRAAAVRWAMENGVG